MATNVASPGESSSNYRGGVKYFPCPEGRRAAFAALVERLPTAEWVLVELHVDALAAKLYSLDAEAKALFGRSFTPEFDLAAGADDALPGESLKWSVAEQLCDGSVVERIACCCGDFAVG